jgi:hypothetical protein
MIKEVVDGEHLILAKSRNGLHVDMVKFVEFRFVNRVPPPAEIPLLLLLLQYVQLLLHLI